MAHIFEKKWRSEDVRLKQNVDFSALLLSERVLTGLQKAGFKKPSPIQLEAVPVGNFGKDLMVQAKSGTGKTLVFVIIALEQLKRKLMRPQVLVIVPTREIATQVCSVIKAVGCTFHKLSCHSFIGGLPLFEDQEKALKTQIVVGTPGRLKQLIQMKALPTNTIRLLIFDEADELLISNSFREDLEEIFNALPDEKQVIATSATFNAKVKKVMYRYLCDPHFIRLNAKHLALLGMTHYAIIVPFCPMPLVVYKHKLQLLEHILKTVRFAQCLLFCNGLQKVEVLYRDIKQLGFSVAYISSAKEQCDRLKAIERLKKFKCKVLVSSDLTSRGIDAENVDLVVNFDLAFRTEIYLHRVGRAGRYGSVGVAISLVDEKEAMQLCRIEKEGSFVTYKLPDPIPKDLILNRPQETPLFSEPVSENVNNSNNPKCDSLSENDNDSEKEVSTTYIQLSDVSETEVNDSNIKCDSEDHYDSVKGVNAKNVQSKNLCETSGDKICEKSSTEQVETVDVKSHDVTINHTVEREIKVEKININDFAHPSNKNIENIQLGEQTTDEKLTSGYTEEDDDVKLSENNNSALLNDCDQNELINSESTDKPYTCDIDDDPDNFCDKSAFVKRDNGHLITQLSIDNGVDGKKDFETIDDKLKELHIDNVPKLSESKDIVKSIEDGFVNSEQENIVKSNDSLNVLIKTFLDTYECKSNKEHESIKLKTTFDIDSQPKEDSSKKLITIDMINNLKSQKNEFFYKTFKKFQESKDECSAVSKNEIEDKETSYENNPNTDLVNENDNIVQSELAEKLVLESKEDVFDKPAYESTPQLKDQNKQDTAKVLTDETVCKAPMQNKLDHLFQEFPDETDSDYSVSSEEVSEVAKQSSTIDSHSSSSKSESLSSSSESESQSSSSDSEDDSDSETDTSSYTSESESCSDSSSTTASAVSDDDESIYHHNYSRTGRQNPSLVSGSVQDQIVSDQIYYQKYFQNHQCACCGATVKNRVSQHPCRVSQARREQNFANCNVSHSYPRKYSRCHRFRISPSRITRRDQNRSECLFHQRSSRHCHSLNCYLPTEHRCHPNTPDHPCKQGPICEMWYKTFYNQWLHIQRVIN